MRAVPLALVLSLVACGGEPDAPVAVDTATVAVAAQTAEADTLLVADADPDAAVVDNVSAPGEEDAAPVVDAEIDESDGEEDTVYVGMWAGEAPLSDVGASFAAVPPVRAKLEEAFGVEPGLLDKLLATPVLYTAPPIEDVGAMLGLTFEPTAENADDRTLHLLVADDASHVFAFLAAPDGDTFYRASHDASAAALPAEADAWMSRKAGVDFGAMVQTNDETELGP